MEKELERKVSCFSIKYDGSDEAIRRVKYYCERYDFKYSMRMNAYCGMFEEYFLITNHLGEDILLRDGLSLVVYDTLSIFEVFTWNEVTSKFTVLHEEGVVE